MLLPGIYQISSKQYQNVKLQQIFEQYMEPQIYEERSQGHQQLSISDNMSENYYIAQFLQIDPRNAERSQSESSRYQQNNLALEQSMSNSSSSQKDKDKLNFHNFQKHLVLTLRNNIIIRAHLFPHHTKGIQRKLWRCFMESPRPTKTLIFLITCSTSEDTNHNKNLQKLYGLHNIHKDNPIQIVRQAKSNLRQEILKQIEGIDLDLLVNNRRMKNKQQFKLYLEQFCNELRDGTLNRRMTKETKTELCKNVKVEGKEEEDE